MLFNSYVFIFGFLPVVLLGFFWLGRMSHAYAAGWLALASLFFYGYWNPAYVGLLLGSIISNYAFGMWIAKAGVKQKNQRKKQLLILAIGLNLLLLGYYKYANFFVESINSVAGTGWSLGEIILPLGISFFTFTQIAFLVDTYRGEVKEYNFIHYTLFVTYFPHLIAGPVLHHKEMMPQFARATTYQINWSNVATGLMLFTLGLCKKTLWADPLAVYADAIFNGVSAGMLPTIYEAWSGALAYTLQIYFDFSGYTDMALGIALMFGVRLPINFNSPYKAVNIIEFWRRWHMTLSRFLRDYLYIPLGGNRKGKGRRYLNLFITMLLGGLWHGAGWTFVIWGALHGIYLMINHAWHALRRMVGQDPTQPLSWPIHIFSGLLTFIAVTVAWVFFRANDFNTALSMSKAMLGIEIRSITFDSVIHGQLLLVTDLSGLNLLKLLIYGLLWIWLLPNSTRLHLFGNSNSLAIFQAGVILCMLYLAIDQFGTYSPFLYFQF